MKLTIAAIGKMRNGPAKKLAQEYHNRLRHYRPLDLLDVRESNASNAGDRQAEESKALLAAVPQAATLVVLDERGEQWTSPKLASWVEKRMVAGTRHLAFVVGGPEGHAETLREQASLLLGLSTLTLPHDLARVVLAEQLYRAFTIIRGEPYHR